MDRNPGAMIWEIIRSGLGLYFLYQQQDWFGAGFWLASVHYIMAGYFALSLFITLYFSLKHKKEDAAIMAI
jgi:hypothetical protein